MSGESNVAIFEYSNIRGNEWWNLRLALWIHVFSKFQTVGVPWRLEVFAAAKDQGQTEEGPSRQTMDSLNETKKRSCKEAKTDTTAAEKNKNQCRRWRLASCVPCTTAVRTESDAPTTVLADRASQLLTETRQHPPRNHQQQRRQTAQDPGHAARFSSIFICFGDLRALPKINVISEDAFDGFKSEVCKPSENGGAA